MSERASQRIIEDMPSWIRQAIPTLPEHNKKPTVDKLADYRGPDRSEMGIEPDAS